MSGVNVPPFGWRPIHEIGSSRASLVVVASPRGIFLQERRIAQMMQHNWLLYHDLEELPENMQYILRDDEYEVHEDNAAPAGCGQEE